MPETPTPKGPDFTGKAVDKLTDALPGSSDNAAKQTLGGVVKGATKGAATGGAHGAALGAVKGGATALLKNKRSRNILLACVVAILVPSIMLGIAIVGMFNMSNGNATEMGLEGDGITAAQKATGMSDDDVQQVKEAADETSVQWPILFSIWQTESQTQSSDGSDGSGAGGSSDSNVAAGASGKGGFSVGAGCAPWPTKVASFLHANWGNNDAGKGDIGCKRTDPNAEDHATGNALDFMIVPTKEHDLGRTVATYLMKNAAAFRIKYLIFEQHIWNPSRDKYGQWRQMADRGSITQNHFDHVHISFNHGEVGTADLSAKPNVTPADIAAAFGGSGSGGDVSGYAGGTDAQDNSKLSNASANTGSDASSTTTTSTPSNLPFGIEADAKGLPKNPPKERATHDYAVYLGHLIHDALANEKDYHGEDIGEGLSLTQDNPPAVVDTDSSDQTRAVMEKAYEDVLSKIPVTGHENAQWSQSVWASAVDLRMGLAPASCSPTGAVSDDSSSPASPSASASASGSASASASASGSASASAPASASASPSASASASAMTLTGDRSKETGLTVTSTTTGERVPVTNGMLMNVATAVQVAKKANLPDKAILVAVMTMGQEERWQNAASPAVPESLAFPHDVVNANYDSVGVFQQRAHTGAWGTAKQIMDVNYSAAMFYGLNPPGAPSGHAPGLLQIPNWEGMAPGDAAQKVQDSAFPTLYTQWETAAGILIKAASGIAVDADGATMGGSCPAADGGSSALTPGSMAAGDNYAPYWNQHGHADGIDPWNFYWGECVSFVAWEVRTHSAHYKDFENNYTHNGKSAHFGNAFQWRAAALTIGIPVDTTPAVGSVAERMGGANGHVAYVTKVNADGSFEVSEYNHRGHHIYSHRLVKKGQTGGDRFDYFIHFEK